MLRRLSKLKSKKTKRRRGYQCLPINYENLFFPISDYVVFSLIRAFYDHFNKNEGYII